MSFLLLPFLDLFKHLTELSCLLSMLLYALLITGSECRIWSDCQGVVTRFRLLTMGCQSLDQLSVC